MTVDLYNSQYLSNLKTEIINNCAINEDNVTSKYKQCSSIHCNMVNIYISIHKQYISILIRGRSVQCNMVNIHISILYIYQYIKYVLNRGRSMHAYSMTKCLCLDIQILKMEIGT